MLFFAVFKGIPSKICNVRKGDELYTVQSGYVCREWCESKGDEPRLQNSLVFS